MSASELGSWVVWIFAAVLLLEILGGHHRLERQSLKDGLFSLAGVTFQTAVAPPLIALVVGWSLSRILPGSAGTLSGASFWAIFPFWFVTEELCHYWLHRRAHEWRWLWMLHRTHHSAVNLNVGVIFRYNLFWTFLLPQTWFGAAAVYLGLTDVFVVTTLITFVVNVLTHTSYRWDLALRRVPGMNATLDVLEKIVTLPDTHHAHHGRGRHAYPRGNYAVTVFLFDVLFGTARIPHARQERFGLASRFDWKEELAWPLARGARRRPAG